MPFTHENATLFVTNNSDELMPLWQDFVGAINVFTDYDSILHLLKCGYIVQDKIKDLYLQQITHHISPDDMATIIEVLFTILSVYQFSAQDYHLMHEVMWDIWDNGAKYPLSLGYPSDSELGQHFCDRISLFVPLLMSLILTQTQIGDRPTHDIPNDIPNSFEAFFIFIIRSLKSKYPDNEHLNTHYHFTFFGKKYKAPVKKETIRKLQIEILKRMSSHKRMEFAQSHAVDRLLLSM